LEYGKLKSVDNYEGDGGILIVMSIAVAHSITAT
jgi:hypothetical protein